jgi:soluble lytic murein transglycosylase-like protein
MDHTLASSIDCPRTKPPFLFPSRPFAKASKRAHGVQRKNAARRAPTDPITPLHSLRTITRIITVIAPFVFQIAGLTIVQPSANAQTAARPEAVDRYGKFIEEASGRFAVPARWIRAVMRVESDGDEHAISPRGGMGLMQLMPDTWVELSVRNSLGVDPFDAHDNILAGTAYLKDMRDRFGSAGFLAAYHAGPARYEQHLATGRPLPQETIAYVAAVTPLLNVEQGEQAIADGRRALPWREAPLFVDRAGAR